MKLSQRMLRRVIKEELSKVLKARHRRRKIARLQEELEMASINEWPWSDDDDDGGRAGYKVTPDDEPLIGKTSAKTKAALQATRVVPGMETGEEEDPGDIFGAEQAFKDIHGDEGGRFAAGRYGGPESARALPTKGKYKGSPVLDLNDPSLAIGSKKAAWKFARQHGGEFPYFRYGKMVFANSFATGRKGNANYAQPRRTHTKRYSPER